MGAGAQSLKREYYDALRQLTLELSGIQLGRDHTFLIETRLAGLARAEGFPSLADMIEELFATGHNRLAVRVVSALLERDARFFADIASAEVFARKVLPHVTAHAEGRPRVLVFGCGSGQDVWTLAMTARQFARAGGHESPVVDIVGADYPSASLERARAGVYTHFEVQRGLPTTQLVNHFSPMEGDHDLEGGDKQGNGDGSRQGDWRVGARLREGVTFEGVHLLGRLDALGVFDAVLFRGALARYSGPARVRVLRGVVGALREGGMLLLGSDEVLENAWMLNAVEGARGLYVKAAPEVVEVAEVKRTRFGAAG